MYRNLRATTLSKISVLNNLFYITHPTPDLRDISPETKSKIKTLKKIIRGFGLELIGFYKNYAKLFFSNKINLGSVLYILVLFFVLFFKNALKLRFGQKSPSETRKI